MAVVQSSKKDSRLKYIYITSVVTCIVLWITVYGRPLSYTSQINKIPDEEFVSDENITTLCTPESFNQGKWIYDPVDLEEPFSGRDIAKAAGYTCVKKFAHRCFRRAGDEVIRAKKIMDYRWQPDSCSLLEMNPKKLADHFVKHPILFVGDSITQLQFESLSCLLGNYFTNRHPAKSDLNGGNSKIRVDERTPENKDTASMAYIRSDYLLRLDDYKMISPSEAVGTQLGRGENYPWVHALSKFDYAIINTGPHWHPNLHWGPNESEGELLVAFKEAVKAVLAYLDKHVKPHQKVWIRTTPYGHAKCSQYEEPQPVPLAPSGQEGEYEWHLFHQFDLIWKDLLSSLIQKNAKKDTRFEMFDITDMSNQRADSHSKPDADCLHTCIPGPVDDWNRLLYHEIMKEITK